MKVLVVVDMQNDFVYGALKNEMAEQIIPDVRAKIEQAYQEDKQVFFTKDTHGDLYMQTEEGRNLPVPHCILGTDGWEIVDELKDLALSNKHNVINKYTFGSTRLGELLKTIADSENIEEIEVIGICTDICVLSNVALIKAFLPNVPIVVDAKCCAGVTRESHDTALNAMKAIQVKIENEGQECWR